jgi:hypothetical protein
MATIELQMPELADIGRRLELLEKAHKAPDRSQSETDSPFQERPDWSLLRRDVAAEMVGVSVPTFNLMIKAGLVADGIQVMGRTKMWEVRQIRELAAHLMAGKFTGITVGGKKEARA